MGFSCAAVQVYPAVRVNPAGFRLNFPLGVQRLFLPPE